MYKTNDNDLKQLINSLTKSEKRYFRLYASRHTIKNKNKYLELFDCLNTEKPNLHVAKALPQLKNYLHKLILKSLLLFHLEATEEDSVKNILRQIDILFYKGLYRQCRILLARAMRIAEKHELYRLVLEIILWERKLILITGSISKKEILRILTVEMRALTMLKNSREVWLQFIHMHNILTTKGYSNSKIEIDRIIAKADELMQQLPPKKTPSEAYNYYFFMHQYYSFMRRDPKRLYHISKKHLSFIEKKDARILKEKINIKTAVLNNLITACTSLGKFDEGLFNAEQLRQLPSKNQYIKQNLIFKSYALELEIHLVKCDYQKGFVAVLQVAPLLQRMESYIKKGTLLAFYYNAFEVCFACAEYRHAKRFLNRIIHDPDTSTREDVHCLARIANLVLQYEMGATETVLYLIPSYKRFLSKHKFFSNPEKCILKYFNKLCKTNTKETKLKLFDELKKQLSTHKIPSFYFDFISWIDSKTQNRSFSEIMKARGNT